MDLRAYYVEYLPVEYLFNGHGKGRWYSQRTIQKVVHDAILKAGLANKDYSDDGQQKQMTLKEQEFIRPFEQHILPKGFTRIRGRTDIFPTASGTGTLNKY